MLKKIKVANKARDMTRAATGAAGMASAVTSLSFLELLHLIENSTADDKAYAASAKYKTDMSNNTPPPACRTKKNKKEKNLVPGVLHCYRH